MKEKPEEKRYCYSAGIREAGAQSVKQPAISRHGNPQVNSSFSGDFRPDSREQSQRKKQAGQQTEYEQ
jgi:hypothetical protein